MHPMIIKARPSKTPSRMTLLRSIRLTLLWQLCDNAKARRLGSNDSFASGIRYQVGGLTACAFATRQSPMQTALKFPLKRPRRIDCHLVSLAWQSLKRSSHGPAVANYSACMHLTCPSSES